MKTMKRFVALVAALVLCLSMMAVPANAAGITITGTQAGVQYDIYKIFDAEVSADDTKAAYKLNPAWADFANDATFKTYFDVSATGYVIPKAVYNDEADAIVFADAAKVYADAHPAAKVGSEAATGASINFAGLTAEGYYLVVSGQGTKLALKKNLTGTLEIAEKNNLPTITKEVKENSTGIFGTANDAGMSDTVTFEITIACEAGAKNYKLSDVMADGFDAPAITSVQYKPAATGILDTLAAANYTTVITGNDFTITFDQDFLNTVADNDEIVVTYTAKVNSSAVRGGATGNVNTATLIYGAASNLTKDDSTKTYVYEIQAAKKDGSTGLGGAQFILKNEAGKYATFDASGNLTGWEDTEGAATVVTSADSTGALSFIGLDAGTYYLQETKSPAGYVRPTTVAEIVITSTINNATSALDNLTAAEDAVDWANVDSTVVSTGVINMTLTNSTTTLPETGGMGTTVLYTAGTIMVLAAVMVLFAKKRMTAEN